MIWTSVNYTYLYKIYNDEVDATSNARSWHSYRIWPTDEPWGVRRFYARDPFGRLINILSHSKN